MAFIFPNQVLNLGSEYATTNSERRNIQVANFISLMLLVAILLVVLIRIVQGGFGWWFYTPLAVESIVCVGALALNSNGHTNIGRLLVCWSASVSQLVNFKLFISHIPVPETSHYVGFKIFLVSFACLPFLAFDITETKRMVVALSIPMLSIFFFDTALEWFHVGYYQVGLTDKSYPYNNVREFISLLVIGSSFLFLKRAIRKQDLENQKLIDELAEKNLVIQKTADHEHARLNKQLSQNLEELGKSEARLTSSERELRRAYERLRYHINNTPLAVIERNNNLEITYWNKRAEELFGWTAAEVLGVRPQDFLLHPEDRARAIQSMDEALTQKRESNFMDIRTVNKNGNVLHCLWYFSFLRNEHGELETVLSFISDITVQRRVDYYLNERIKELRTLYNVSQLLTTSGKSMHDVFTSFPGLLPPGWQYPDICAARLEVSGVAYQTENYRESPFAQSIKIEMEGTEIGRLEVVYLEETPREHEGPFFKEERDLLTGIAGMLQVYIERKLEEEELLKAQANLSATINNTQILIWSVDENFNLITYNEAFRKHATTVLNAPIHERDFRKHFAEGFKTKWFERYKRALTGEALTLEETSNGIDFRFSLSPIIENKKVIGVSIFADNITEQNRQHLALREANNKISELKMLALRSVMNPHFIFNVLSSIQYFITRNDQLNAINYLTSFSKLMRTVLTRSVADAVTVKEEIDLLKDYVHLEKLRFEDKFEFVVDCDPSIDVANITLPSLLIQPYVENAILHGLYNKEGKGTLLLRVRATDEFLCFDVEDDGVGREAAAKYQEKNQSKRKSMGTQLTEERLKIFNGDAEPPVTFHDLYTGKSATGTRVTIRIKIA